jgi:mediator of RNA polymerase II transcription subunit 14
MSGDVRNRVTEHSSNGLPVKPAISYPGGQVAEQEHGRPNGVQHAEAQPQAKIMANGIIKSGLSDAAASKLLNGLKDMPPEIEEVAREYFVGLGTLISRSAQDSWNNLTTVISELSKVRIKPAAQPKIAGTNTVATRNGPPQTNTTDNIEKKEKLLNFAKDQKDVFVKLLVLLDWSKDVEGVSRIIDLNRWLRDRISRYGEVATDIARMKRYLAFIQIPNPDLRTAVEILSGQTASGFSDLGYVPPKPLTNKQALKTLRSLNSLLCTRLTLHEDLPLQLQNYRVHDGRVTFYVKHEFELDVSVLSENFESQFCLADFRFIFSPAADLPAGRIFDDLAFAANDVLGKTGLMGCYEFLHEFTLSYKVNVLFKQALELLQGHWSGNLRVELIHRTLVIQYWTNRYEKKSWIEIGIKSGGRKRKAGQSDASKDLSIGVRWMHAGKEIEDADIELDVHHLSVETLLRQTIAQHTNRMFDKVFDNLTTVPLYEKGELRLDQSASATEPSDCSIELELARERILKVAIQTVTGAIVMTPTSGLCSQVEADLNRSRSIVEELPKRLSYLRIKTAEEDLISQAEATGWVILRSFVPSAAEKTKWFSPPVHRTMFLRCPHWEAGHMLAATHSAHGDEWWLLTQENATWTSQLLRIESRHKERQITHAYMRSLQDYCSGVIVLQQNARRLNTMSIKCALGNIPPIGTNSKLPHITLDFQPARLDPILKPERLSKDWEQDQLGLSMDDKPTDDSYIRKVVTVKYLGQSLDTGAHLEVIGSTQHSHVDENMLAYLRQTIHSSTVTFRPKEENFSIRITAVIGKPAIEELLRRLLHLETIFACVKAVRDSPSAAITFLSLDSIAMRYRSGAATNLGIDIRFGTSSKPHSIELTPKGENPHDIIRQPLLELLSQPRQKFSASLASILPLLSSTHSLVMLFGELQSEKWYETFGLEVEANTAHLLPRIHIMARHTTMFGIQLYAPNGFNPPAPSGPHRTTGMLVRFEMLPLTRRGQTKWLLRPAIEEFESYSQPSYCCVPLKETLEQEIFKTTEPQGWQAIDSGAACGLNEPKPLLQATLRVVVEWMKDYSASETRNQVQALPAAQTEKLSVKNAAPVQPSQAQKTRPNTNTNRTSDNKGPIKGPQEVITLD